MPIHIVMNYSIVLQHPVNRNQPLQEKIPLIRLHNMLPLIYVYV